MDFGAVELRYGLGSGPKRGREDGARPSPTKVFLYGDCAIRSHMSFQRKVKGGIPPRPSEEVFLIEGCSPTLNRTLLVLTKALLSKPRMLRALLVRTMKLIGIRLGIYREMFPGWERYRSKEFDQSHFS